jgi:hypothetical protein
MKYSMRHIKAWGLFEQKAKRFTSRDRLANENPVVEKYCESRVKQMILWPEIYDYSDNLYKILVHGRKNILGPDDLFKTWAWTNYSGLWDKKWTAEEIIDLQPLLQPVYDKHKEWLDGDNVSSWAKRFESRVIIDTFELDLSEFYSEYMSGHWINPGQSILKKLNRKNFLKHGRSGEDFDCFYYLSDSNVTKGFSPAWVDV